MPVCVTHLKYISAFLVTFLYFCLVCKHFTDAT